MADTISNLIDFLMGLFIWFFHTTEANSLSAVSNLFCFRVRRDLDECMSKSRVSPSLTHNQGEPRAPTDRLSQFCPRVLDAHLERAVN